MNDIIQIKCPFCGAVLSVKNIPGIENKSVTCPICKQTNRFDQYFHGASNAVAASQPAGHQASRRRSHRTLPVMKYRLKAYSILEYGQRKDSSGLPHQEDCLYPPEGRLSDRDRTFILCDGMGGHDAGEVASSTVCDAIGSALQSGLRDREGVFDPVDFSGALDSAFRALDNKDTYAAKKMGTTLAFLRLHAEGAFIAHIGDSRVYHIRPGKTGNDTEILHETSDHSLINELVKAGELTREQARSAGQKNVITRAMQPHLGRRPEAEIHTTSDIKAGDYFYLCSDGMLEQPDMESGASLRNIFSKEGGSPADKVQILRSVTARNKDNHSAFIIHIEEVSDAQEPPQAKPGRSKLLKTFCIAALASALLVLLAMLLR